MIYDKNFLLKLDQCKNKIIYAKITALTLQELPIETIEGRVTQGSINLDGASAVRRICSLTVVAQDFNYSNYAWGLNTKFELEIGVENTIDGHYDKIIWFKQGIYFISSFNISRSSNNFSISIQGKDKMSMLNGELGGSINSSVDFGTIEEEDQNGNWIIRKLPIKDIIRNMVHQYGGEPLHNIIINDIPDYGLELLEYRYDVPMYLYKLVDTNIYDNATLDDTIVCSTEIWDNDSQTFKPERKDITFAELMPHELESLVDPLMGSVTPARIQIGDKYYTVAKVEYGQTAGYRQTPLTYAGDLIANVGDAITSVLDKIKNMLGEFEYFYDLDGRFIFQQKQSFVNTLYNPMSDSDGGENNKELQLISNAHSEANQYVFNGGELVTTFNNNPNLAGLRNDYSVWGQRTTVSGTQVPVHLRYAIDTKPIEYTTINVDMDNENDKQAIDEYNRKNGTTLQGQESITYSASDSDWREVIYQMASDYYKYNHLDDFELKVAAANPIHYPFGMTGYEQYYIDIQGFWRQLYDPTFEARISNIQYKIDILSTNIKNLQLEIDNVDNTISISEMQKKELQLDTWNTEKLECERQLEQYKEDMNNYYYSDNHPHLHWNKNVFEQPEALNFWFDFLDTEGELSRFNTKIIGCRPKAVNDTDIKSIYFRKTPNVLFGEKIDDNTNSSSAYKYIQAPGILKMFSISAQGKSAKTKLDELLYQYGYCAETATINCIPIYYLQPNVRIHIYDEETNLNGDYIISKITIPLTYNGTMSLTATKAAETFLY